MNDRIFSGDRNILYNSGHVEVVERIHAKGS